MFTVILIFRRNFAYTAVYGKIRYGCGLYIAVIQVTVKRHRICVVYGRICAVFPLSTVVKHRPGIRSNTVSYTARI